jgi:hypothetical protein
MSKIFQYLAQPRFLIFTISLTILLHVFFLDLPPKSMHLWRQSHTLSMTRNFFEEGMNPFLPRVDNRFDTDGITGSQFPSFEIVLASIYHITGEQYWVQRLYCLLLHLLGIWGIFKLSLLMTSKRLFANIAAWTYAWSPMLFYYAITALPDNVALPASIWGLYFFMLWFKKWVLQGKPAYLEMLGSLTILTLAGLTKIQYLAVGFFILAYIWQQRKLLGLKHWLAFTLFGAATSAMTVGWYVYARMLIKKSGLKDFGLHFNPETDLKEGLWVLFINLTSTLPELILNYSAFVLLLASAYFLFTRKKEDNILRNSFFVWAGVFVIYHLIELGQMTEHDYYMMPYMPVLVIASAYGTFHLFAINKFQKIVLLLILIQPILAFIRIGGRFISEEKEHSVFYNEEALHQLQDCAADDALCIVGPDPSRCIYFYFLYKKGFGFGGEGLVGPQVKDYITRGAEYLYTSDAGLATDPLIASYIDSTLCQVDKFFVYSLKKADE